MYYLTGIPVISGKIHWAFNKGNYRFDKEEGLKISFDLATYGNPTQKRQAVKLLTQEVLDNKIPWITPGYKNWIINLNILIKHFSDLNEITWLKGIINLEPELESENEIEKFKIKNSSRIVFYITQETILGEMSMIDYPIEIQDSINRFKLDYPDPSKVCFIIMKFGDTTTHKSILKTIKELLKTKGITGLRADDKQYHDDLFPNILTYIYGSSFGLAVFERIEADDFNPNVSLEVGYMIALKKPICLLRDMTLKILHTDLVGKLYKTFDTQNVDKTIKKVLLSWL